MRVISPLLGSQHSPEVKNRQWRLAGHWRRSMNFLCEEDECLTLHRQGSGISPGGWVLRRQDFDALREMACSGAKCVGQPGIIGLGNLVVTLPVRQCSLRLTSHRPCAGLASKQVVRADETGLFGPLWQAVQAPLIPELRQFGHCFKKALQGYAVDWRLWLGKGPGLTPSHDDTLTGMLLAAWHFGVLDERAGERFFNASGRLEQATTLISVNYLRHAARGRFASPLIHFTAALGREARLMAAMEALVALGHTSGSDTLLGFWLGQRIIKG